MPKFAEYEFYCLSAGPAGLHTHWVDGAFVAPDPIIANTNAPLMMIGHRAAQFITQDAA